MSDAGSLDFRTRFLKLFGYTVIAVTIGVVIWGVIALGIRLFGNAGELRCRNNLRSLMEAMTTYGTTYGSQLPPTLAHLLPFVEKRSDKFQCPADLSHGLHGCRPAWLKRADGNLFDYVDLDGSTMDPEKDRDTLPSSYLYAANGYPCGLADFKRTWREEFDDLVEKHGKGVPLVRCYYHLREKYLPAKPGEQPVPDPQASPTYNITADLEHIREYMLDWQTDPNLPGN